MHWHIYDSTEITWRQSSPLVDVKSSLSEIEKRIARFIGEKIVSRISSLVTCNYYFYSYWWFRCKLAPSRITGSRQHCGNVLPFIGDSVVCHVKEPPWTLICLLRLPLWLNLSKQSLHWYGFSPEWILKCFVRVELSENAFLQNLHLRKCKCIIFTIFLW